MSTTVSSLVQRVRALLDDYGDSATVLTAAVSTTDGTSVSVADSTSLEPGAFFEVDYEIMEVSTEQTGAADTITVRRGAKGTTAATHSDAAVVRIGQEFGSSRILDALNASLAGAYPQIYTRVVDSSTLSVVADQEIYDIPASIDQLCSIEVETYTDSDQFALSRAWEFVGKTQFKLFGLFSAGLLIKLIGMAPFSTMTTAAAEDLDGDFPDTDQRAIQYLLYDAAGRLKEEWELSIPNTKEALESEATQATLVSLRAGQFFRKRASEELRKAKMPPLATYVPLPARGYYGLP